MDFIERIFNISPDDGSGSLEVLVVTVIGALLIWIVIHARPKGRPPGSTLTTPEMEKGVPGRSPSVHIHLPVNDNGIGPIEGETLTIACSVDEVTNLSGLAFSWSVDGASLANNQTGKGSSIQIILPSPALPVCLSVSVQGPAGLMVGETKFMPLRSADLAWLNQFCELRRTARTTLFLDPVLDPTRDVVEQPVTLLELERVAMISQQMAAMAQRALTLREQASPPSQQRTH